MLNFVLTRSSKLPSNDKSSIISGIKKSMENEGSVNLKNQENPIMILDEESIGEINTENIQDVVNDINNDCIFRYRLLVNSKTNCVGLYFDKTFYGKLVHWKTKLSKISASDIIPWIDKSNF
jgi:hypothetical protein